jgi:glycosyltransferase involved in cell wall biosynthesis
MADHLLSILIPTYNRSEYLEKNLKQMIATIQVNGFTDKVDILVSNNCSEDQTEAVLDQYRSEITSFRQEKNIGLESNALFLLKSAVGKYVMYLGDDDFLDENYLPAVLEYLGSNDPPTVVLPSILGVTTDGRVVAQRNVGMSSRLFKPGRLSAAIKMGLGHQLSGVALLREGLLQEYKQRQVANIYPFVFFVGFNALRGTVLHLTHYPVRVTEGVQKDWAYGTDALFGDFLQNYYKLFGRVSIFRVFGEFFFLVSQRGRAFKCMQAGVLQYARHCKAVMQSRNISPVFKFFYVPLSLGLALKGYLVWFFCNRATFKKIV